MFELSQSFYFESAHTLRRAVERNEADGSRRVHGHTYTAEVSVQGRPKRSTGMVVDLAVLRAAIAEVRGQLDHHFLDEVPGLGVPTLENLCVFIHDRLKAKVPAVVSVSVGRQSSGDRCTYRGPGARGGRSGSGGGFDGPGDGHGGDGGGDGGGNGGE